MAVCSSAENTYSCCSNIGGSSFKSISCTFTSASPVRVASVISVALIWKKVQMLFTIQSILLYLQLQQNRSSLFQLFAVILNKTHQSLGNPEPDNSDPLVIRKFMANCSPVIHTGDPVIFQVTWGKTETTITPKLMRSLKREWPGSILISNYVIS